jgi:SpoVK/Ycf46/Vps4 family AAA+-type ATPase
MHNGTDQDEQGIQQLLRLWLCRLFSTPEGVRKLISEKGFASERIALQLGMDEWLESGGKFDAAGARSALRNLLEKLDGKGTESRETLLWRNVAVLGKALSLNQAERLLLQFCALNETFQILEEATGLFGDLRRSEFNGLLARMLNLSVGQVGASLTGRAPLVQGSILKWQFPKDEFRLRFCESELRKSLMESGFSLDVAIATVALPAPSPTLRYADYPHLRETLSYLRSCLRRTLREKRVGMNVYIYGPPGTGKSELVRVIGREMRAGLFEISSRDEDGDSSTGEDRLISFRSALALLGTGRHLIVFDEAEDVFRGQSIFKRSLADSRKGWINQILESNTVPVFWISNTRRGLDPAFARRFDFVVESSIPPKRQRIRTFRKICGRKASPDLIQTLSDCKDLAPAVVARAHDVAEQVCKAQPGVARDRVLLHVVQQTLKAQGHRTDGLQQVGNRKPDTFDPGFLNSKLPLQAIVDQFDKSASCRICLHGPPGTGKSSFGYWLADKLDASIQVRRASDILSPFLGETEQNLARIFGEARDEQAILMIDEVDSFLQDRRQAQRSWEVTQVNEFLTQMELYAGIFIASTNLVDGLDQASLRRFDLKIVFDCLREEQVLSLLERYCRSLELGRPCPETCRQAALISNATPGDFANVARQHRFRRFCTAGEFPQAVTEECRMKEGRNRRRVGF